jgi:hypothetical protein
MSPNPIALSDEQLSIIQRARRDARGDQAPRGRGSGESRAYGVSDGVARALSAETQRVWSATPRPTPSHIRRHRRRTQSAAIG